MNSSSIKRNRKVVPVIISPLPNQRITRSMQKQLSNPSNFSKPKNNKSIDIEEIVTSKKVFNDADSKIKIESPLTINRSINHNTSSLNNLKIGVSQKKAEKFKFMRKQGQKLDSLNRQ